jgi:GTPase SAR1 family protein
MSVLGPYGEVKDEVIGALQALGAAAERVGLKTLRDDLLMVRVPKLLDERFIMVVLGEFNRGKSTFVNALLGKDVLPTGITPTTATLNQIVWAETPYARVVARDGGRTDLPIDTLGRYTTDGVGAAGIDLANVSHLEVGYPAEVLRERVTLVDTPGVNDLNEQRAEVTYGYLPRADAAIFLLDASQVITRSEEEFLKNRVLRRSRDKLIFVVGKTDLLSPQEVGEALAYARGHLARVVDEPAIFPVSAKRYMAGKLAESGMPELLAYLKEHLADERGKILLDNAIADGLRSAGYLRQNLEIKRRSYKMSIEELEEKIRLCHARLDENRRALQEYHRRIQEGVDGIKATVRNDLDLFTTAFLEALPGEIDRADADDLKKYLASYIQDKFREWVEMEGEKMGALCERLAEEIVEVTNENISETVRALAGHFSGPGERIPLDVNTLGYDIGVFALGAVGTIFLFVNLIVGGILTIAAPILAIVLKERVAGEVKERAKVEARKAVAEASKAVEPRLSRFIDDFGTRLADFVTSAGETLHRGVSEVLDAALVERRQAGFAAPALEAEIGARVVEVEVIEDRLWALKEALWGKGAEGAGAGAEMGGAAPAVAAAAGGVGAAEPPTGGAAPAGPTPA